MADGTAGERNGRAKVTVEMVAEIRRRATGRYGERAELARQFGLTASTISKIILGQTWAVLLERQSDAARFEAKVDRRGPDECWLFQGEATHQRVRFNGRTMGAHVVAFLMAGGDLDVDAPMVLHSCDVGGCCNPAHLRAGTAGDNMRDKLARARDNSKLTPAQVQEIRLRFHGGYGQIKRLAMEYGVGRQAISDVVHERTWAWLPSSTT